MTRSKSMASHFSKLILVVAGLIMSSPKTNLTACGCCADADVIDHIWITTEPGHLRWFEGMTFSGLVREISSRRDGHWETELKFRYESSGTFIKDSLMLLNIDDGKTEKTIRIHLGTSTAVFNDMSLFLPPKDQETLGMSRGFPVFQKQYSIEARFDKDEIEFDGTTFRLSDPTLHLYGKGNWCPNDDIHQLVLLFTVVKGEESARCLLRASVDYPKKERAQ